MHVPFPALPCRPARFISCFDLPTQPTVLSYAGPGTQERTAELCQGCAASEGGAACPPLGRDWQAPSGFTRLPPGYVFLRRAVLVCHVAVPDSGFGLCVPAEARADTAKCTSLFRLLGSAPLGQLCGMPESCTDARRELQQGCRAKLPVAVAPPRGLASNSAAETPAAYLCSCSRAALKVPLDELHWMRKEGVAATKGV